MATINPGYMGWAKFGGGTPFRFADANIAAKQEVNAPDLITGYWRRSAYNMGPIDISGTISGPVTEGFASAGTGMWEKATARGSCGELEEGSLEVHYFCSNAAGVSTWTWPVSKVNSLTFSCAAGDVAQFSMDMIAAQAPTTSAEAGTFTDLEKLLTWDKVTLTVTAGDANETWDQSYFQNFEVTFANNVEAQYALSGTESDLYPFALVDGLSTITGSVSAYNIPSMFGADTWDDYTAAGLGTIAFNVGSGVQTLNVRWHRVEPAASVGPIISTVGFTAVGPQLGE